MKLKLLAGLLLATLISCTDANPLLGEWQVLPGSGPDTVAQTIQFTDSQSISRNTADNVTYEIMEDRVIVTSSLGFNLIYMLVDADTIKVNLAGIGPVTYARVKTKP